MRALPADSLRAYITNRDGGVDEERLRRGTATHRGVFGLYINPNIPRSDSGVDAAGAPPRVPAFNGR
jgi:hypothetical protein